MLPHEAHDTLVLALDQATQKGCYTLQQAESILQALSIIKTVITDVKATEASNEA